MFSRQQFEPVLTKMIPKKTMIKLTIPEVG
jgi:hypothetical protein